MKWVIINDTSIGGAYRAAKNYSLIINEKYRDTDWDILSEENIKTSKTFVKRMIGYGF